MASGTMWYLMISDKFASSLDVLEKSLTFLDSRMPLNTSFSAFLVTPVKQNDL